jgi:hypothetical protein
MHLPGLKRISSDRRTYNRWLLQSATVPQLRSLHVGDGACYPEQGVATAPRKRKLRLRLFHAYAGGLGDFADIAQRLTFELRIEFETTLVLPVPSRHHAHQRRKKPTAYAAGFELGAVS